MHSSWAQDNINSLEKYNKTILFDHRIKRSFWLT